MSGRVAAKTLRLPAREVDISLESALRYMGLGSARPEAGVALAREAIAAFGEAARYAACYVSVPVSIDADEVGLGLLRVASASLARHLEGCDTVVLFAATTGMESERQRKRAAVASPTLALALDAVGTAAIERFCDMLCGVFAKDYPGRALRPRFSPGYGDLPLAAQKPLLELLDAGDKAG
ncbi:MAG TPA: hypothetical protein VN540_06820, partial [Clostridia bacterium]|nr:hypothetical protein [Clostridia bacterium]